MLFYHFRFYRVCIFVECVCVFACSVCALRDRNASKNTRTRVALNNKHTRTQSLCHLIWCMTDWIRRMTENANPRDGHEKQWKTHSATSYLYTLHTYCCPYALPITKLYITSSTQYVCMSHPLSIDMCHSIMHWIRQYFKVFAGACRVYIVKVMLPCAALTTGTHTTHHTYT